jgi:hypothetical protein
LGCCFFAYAAFARQVESKIGQVTVYGNMALITRYANLGLQAGENRLEIGHLPMAMLDESVHLKLNNDSQVQISDVKVQSWFLEKPEEMHAKKIEQELLELEKERVQYGNEIKALKSQEKFLSSIQVAADAKSSQELLAGKMDVVSWNSTLAFLRKNLTEVYNGISDLEWRQKEVENKREALKKN